jgi:RNA polymerase sigma factor (sigma-70 family)
MNNIDKRKEEKMLRDYEKLIYKLANKNYLRYNKKYAFEDVLQEAKISALRAYRIFDPSKNVKLITHLHNYITFYLSHFFRSDTGLIKIPSRVMSDKTKTKPELVQNDFLYDNSTENDLVDIDFYKISDNKFEISSLMKVLNQKEIEILKLIYIEGYTYDEVAIMYNVTRQAINTMAKKSLKKIKDNSMKSDNF